MKKFSKLFAIVTIIAMLVTSLMSVTVYADPVTGSAIIINKPENQHLSGQTFSAYQIFGLSIIDLDGDGPGTETSYLYSVLPEFKPFFAEYFKTEDIFNDDGYTADGANILDVKLNGIIADIGTDSDELNDMAQALLAFIGDDIDPTQSVTVKADEDPASVEINGLPLGYYMVYGSVLAENNVKVIAACALKTNDTPVNITPKADAPAIDKQVKNDHTGVGNVDDLNTATDGTGWNNWTDLDIGDTAEFRLLSRVPKMVGYESYTYIVHDKMSKGLTFNPASVEVYIDGAQITDPAGKYTVSQAANTSITDDTDPYYGSTDITITFDPTWFVGQQTGDSIEIKYNALVNENAIISKPGNPNKAHLEYSNDPNWDGTGKTPTGETPDDEVFVYTYEINVFKYTGTLNPDGSLAANSKALAGAEFTLFNNTTVPTEIDLVLVSAGSETDPAVYRPLTSDDADTDKVLAIISPASGKIVIKGLDDNATKYLLVETKAPVGYNRLRGNIDVTVAYEAVSDTDTTGIGDYSVSYTYDGTTISEATTGNKINRIDVLNKTGIEFPETGGIGRTIFILVGATMVGAGLICLVIFRKKIFPGK